MKKLFLTLSLVATLVFTGCSDNDNAVNPQPLGKATVSGKVTANFDFTNDTDGTTYDAVAIKLNVTVLKFDSNDIVSTMEVTTDSNGAYTFDVPVGNLQLDVHIVPVDFRHDVKVSSTVTNKDVIFHGNDVDQYVTITKGGSYIVDLQY